ncbi:MAG TPA: SDR family NAD(P)-dependent oxidoreductase, partial [Chitinophagaceae bacterium]|nr:SDR family NAD(P)-dependent oxidoreductase [Chitinophagaceae bacterium]
MVTLITGTSSGVGLETALLFAKNGYSVYASMRDTTKNEKLLAAAKHENFDLKIIELDVCNTASIQKAVDTVIREEGTIDILVNNAGAGFAKSTEQATDEEIQWVIQTNLLSVIRCTKAVLPIMKAQKSGHIINLSSVGGLVGQPFNELYCAAKFGVEGYTEAMATYIT